MVIISMIGKLCRSFEKLVRPIYLEVVKRKGGWVESGSAAHSDTETKVKITRS